MTPRPQTLLADERRFLNLVAAGIGGPETYEAELPRTIAEIVEAVTAGNGIPESPAAATVGLGVFMARMTNTAVALAITALTIAAEATGEGPLDLLQRMARTLEATHEEDHDAET